ncbi:endonuclease/exonuclease/phosphatase family protein [Cochleicola gelatinilyticus]|uniref:Endonuclease n=1 Tax=Cochleicola gelatinilyticus TaxID=1763537 RepID=A0A167IWN5_9FLAO|nr:endonuclease/exonuclease/phosphatase family protein [Cochleicola gelatinilyticus]OAB80089.1 endonuclease [Cochleicola gelatinilyticus]
MTENSSEKIKSQYTFAFYNLENLFDTKEDPLTLDDDFTAEAPRKWTEKRFQNKLNKISQVISKIGYNEILHPPVLVGVAEVENEYVMQQLIASKFLKEKNYGYIHVDSPDERGIDTAFLYRKDFFTVLHFKAHTLYLKTETGQRDFTRDVLHIKGKLENEEVHVIVNHWPSRRSGANTTESKRIKAAEKNREIITSIKEEDPNARIIVMGDFNTDPDSNPIEIVRGTDFYNPMELLLTKYEGSLNHKSEWNLFDQILVSNNFLQLHGNKFRFKISGIFNQLELKEVKGRYKGNPFRTYAGQKYLGGISDHFPVYTIFEII